MNSMVLGSPLELKKVETAVSKHLGIRPKIRERGNSAKVWVKTASSETIIVFFVFLDLHVVWWFCEVSVFIFLVISLPRCQQYHLTYIFLNFCSG